jgi:hypothetical protein
MTMNRIFVLIGASLLFCVGAFAQGAPPGDVMFFQSAAAGQVGGVTSSGGMFFSTEMPGSAKVVTGAPYTATASTEMTQVLSDGNRIVNKNTTSLARDSQGRTRREETRGMVGPWQVNGPKLVFINDPASQTNMVLDANKQMATVLKAAGFNAANADAGFKMVTRGPGGLNAADADAGFGGFKVVTKGPGGEPEEAKTESLGTQTMEGVIVEGKRVTRTIPAGQIGNTQPIEIVSEVWTSPDLQVTVMSKHSDPRFGETTYQLTGIHRAEPDHSLFEIPPGYTVRNMPAPPGLPQVPDGEPVTFGIFGGQVGGQVPTGK